MNANNDLPPIIPPVPPQPPATSPNQNTDSNSNQAQQHLGYDTTGAPVYGVPVQSVPKTESTTQEQVVSLRSNNAPRMTNTSPSAIISPALHPKRATLHAASVTKYPELNLSDDEYVIADVERHIIGILVPVFGGILLICLILIATFTYPLLTSHYGVSDSVPNAGVIALAGILLSVIVAGLMYIAVWIYRANRFFLTNESVIQEIQTSLFVKREQTVSLGNIEDASFSQHGILQSLFNYGSIRLSTEGDETTYRMDYIATPRKQIAELTNAVEDFKNGRQVGDDD